MKNFNYYLVVMVLFVFQSTSVFSQGKINKVIDGDLFTIVVKGYASEKLWIGCTINPDTYSEIDLKPKRVSKGNYEVSFNLSTGAANSLMRGNSSIPYVVALWEEKISLKECEKRYGKGSKQCKWARKNGYQFEGRIDRYSGRY